MLCDEVIAIVFVFIMCTVGNIEIAAVNLLWYVGDLADAVRNRTDIHFGLYHSLYEWFNPSYIADSRSNFTTRHFVEVCTRHSCYLTFVVTDVG